MIIFPSCIRITYPIQLSRSPRPVLINKRLSLIITTPLSRISQVTDSQVLCTTHIINTQINYHSVASLTTQYLTEYLISRWGLNHPSPLAQPNPNPESNMRRSPSQTAPRNEIRRCKQKMLGRERRGLDKKGYGRRR